MRTVDGPNDIADRTAPPATSSWIERSFSWTEDIVYIGLSVLLSLSAIGLLGHTANAFLHEMTEGLPEAVINLLDRLLLVLMIVELMYTVQVSSREHILVPKPFLIIGLVATVRRILVLTAEFANVQANGEAAVRVAMLELVLLTIMVLALVASLRILQGRRVP